MMQDRTTPQSFTMLAFDELTHFEEEEYTYIISSRVRSTDPELTSSSHEVHRIRVISVMHGSEHYLSNQIQKATEIQ